MRFINLAPSGNLSSQLRRDRILGNHPSSEFNVVLQCLQIVALLLTYSLQ